MATLTLLPKGKQREKNPKNSFVNKRKRAIRFLRILLVVENLIIIIGSLL
jgi:hypothetical protein